MSVNHKHTLVLSFSVNLIFAVMLALSYFVILELRGIESELSNIEDLEKRIDRRLSKFNEGMQFRLEKSDQKIERLHQEFEYIRNEFQQLAATLSRVSSSVSQDGQGQDDTTSSNIVDTFQNGNRVENRGQYRRLVQPDGRVIYELKR